MALSGLTNEVLRLLLAQNNLAISGTRDQLIERLGTIEQSLALPSGSRTRSADPNDSAANKRPRLEDNPDATDHTNTDPPRLPDNPDQNVGHQDIDPPNAHGSQVQDGDRAGGVPQNPAALATLISTIIDEKLKSIQPAAVPQPHQLPQSSLLPPQPTLPPPQPQQLTLQQQLEDPRFVASLLSQPNSITQPPSQASLASHVPSKTRQAILRGEYVEFDSLLPENSCLDGDHPGLSISFDGKQINVPSPARKKKTYIDSIDKWLSAFAVYCTILLVNFPQRAVEMFSYQEIIRSAQRKFAGFAWLSYDIDFRRKAASNLALSWGARDIQLYLMKFTGQAKSSCTICGSGDHFAYGCSLSDLRPNSSQRGTCNNYNRGFKCSQDPCPFSHRCKICNGDHPSHRHDDPSPKTRSQGDKKSSNR